MDIFFSYSLINGNLRTILFANTSMVSVSKISKHLMKPPFPRKRPQTAQVH